MSGYLQKPGGGSSFTGVTVDGTTIVGDGLTTPLSAVFNQQGKYMISGGAVWSGTGLVYDVSFLNYFFDGLKTANASQVTLDASDPSNNRIDAIVVDEAGIVSVITGDPSSSPVEPPIPEDQLQVQFILVEAGSVTPTIASEEIYMDDPTTDWTFTTYDAASPATGTIDFAGTSSPKQGTECIEASTDLRRGARFVRGTSFDAYQYTMLQVWVRFTGTAVASNKSLNVRFENSAGTLVGSTVNLFSYGLQRGVLNTWQLVVVPITAFGALPATVKGLKMIMAGGTVGVVRQWDVDYMILTNGSVPYANVPTIAFYKDGIGFASQPALDLVAGTGVTITPYNDVTNQRARYTISASGGLSGTTNRIPYFNSSTTITTDSNFTRNTSTQATLMRAGTATDYGQLSFDNNDATLKTSFNGGSDFSQVRTGTSSTSLSYSTSGNANTITLDGSSFGVTISDGIDTGTISLTKDLFTLTGGATAQFSALIGSTQYLKLGSDEAILGKFSIGDTVGFKAELTPGRLGAYITNLFGVYDNPNNNVFLEIKPVVGTYKIGDIDGIANGNKIEIDDTNNTIKNKVKAGDGIFTVERGATGLKHLEINESTKIATIGETTSDNNPGGTYIKVDWADDATKSIELHGGIIESSIVTVEYGTTNSVNYLYQHYIITGSTGATTMNLDFTYQIGQKIRFSDVDRISSTSNITIDAQTGNTIISQSGSAQTFVMSTNGQSITIEKITSTQWMVIESN